MPRLGLRRRNGATAPPWVPAPRAVIDPEQAGLDPDALGMPAPVAALDAPPVFISGCARSGTTWTLDLFGAHPEVAAVMEPWLLTQTHGITSVLAQPQWIPAFREAAYETIDLPTALVQLVPYEEMVRDLSELTARWLMRAVGPEHRYLVVKEPIDVRAAAVLFPRSRFINVVRDGRDVALSMRRAGDTWDPSMGRGKPMQEIARTWRYQVENVRSHAEWLGDRYLEVRYEDMRRDVVGTTRRLFDFAGIRYDEDVLERVRHDTDLSNQSAKARASGFRGGARGGWRNELGVRDAFAFDRAAGQLLVDLGYERDRRWWLGRLRSVMVPRRDERLD